MKTLTEYLPILFFFAAVLGFALFSLIAPHLIAPRKSNAIKGMPYESGVDPTGDSQKPLDVKFYLIGILFLIFDVELTLIYPYAVALKAEGGIDSATRPLAFAVMVLLLATVGLAYVYARKKGVMQWRKQD